MSTPGTGLLDPQRLGKWLPVAAVVLSVVALGLAVWALLSGGSGQSYSDAQAVEAKAKACAAYGTVRQGISLNTNMEAPGGPEDAVGSLAVAANARLALYGGGQYLLDRLDPATPTELADAASQFANLLMDVAAAQTAGAQTTEPDLAAKLRDVESQNAEVDRLCK